MPLWEVEFDQKVRAFRHHVAPGLSRALLVSAQSFVFESLGLSAALWLAGDDWFPLHVEHGVMAFESAPGVDSGRGPYNVRNFARVKKSRETLLSEHNGFWDFFVPVRQGREVVAILTVGPFSRSRPSAAEIQERWRTLTGRQGHPSDPLFAGYVSATLSTIVLDAAQLAALERLLENWARLATEGRDAGALANAIERDRVLLDPARHVDRIWSSVREMVDERFTHLWYSRAAASGLFYWGLARAPDRVLVGLATSRSETAGALEEIVRQNALQRAVVEVARRSGALSGRVGDHGVVLVAVTKGSERRRIAQLSELAWQVSTWARRKFSVSLHFGTAEAPEQSSLARRYQLALAAAQSALFEGKELVVLRGMPTSGSTSLENMRRALDRMLAQNPDRLESDFDHYLEVVLSECGHRFDVARTHAELGFERLLETLARQSVLDETNLATIRADLEQSVSSAANLNEVFDHYRRAISNLAKASRSPVPARQERNLQRAIAHIEQHFTEPLRLDHVARVAGFAPKYFSKLFVRTERVPFGRYVTWKRVERAKQLLTTTEFNLSRIARASGFPTAAYLCTVFKRATGTTPKAWRAQAMAPRTRRHQKRKRK